MPFAEFARRMGKSISWVKLMAFGGLFTVIQDQPGKRGSPRFIPADEADYAERHGLAALQEYRKAKARRAKA